MKKVILCTMLLLALVCATSVWAVNHKHQQKPAADTTEAVTTDTVESSEPTYVDSVDSTQNYDSSDSDNYSLIPNSFGGNKTMSRLLMIPIIGTICGTLLVVIIIFLIFYFRYKNRQARYRLAEKALESGKPLPEGFFTADAANAPRTQSSHPAAYNTTERDKGIRNAFLGFGLFVFLWAITGEFGVGCIGLLVMFIGLGRWYVYYEHRKDAQLLDEMMKNKAEENSSKNVHEESAAGQTEASATPTEETSDNVKKNDSAAE